MGLMAIDAAAFGKLSAPDQAAFRETMEATYRRFDQQSREDDRAARDALMRSGIQRVEASPAEVQAWREAVTTANKRLGEKGVYSPALLDQVQVYLEEQRRNITPNAARP
jgi:TRAP-type C4-dicarboxylate transport system substrate-binding protein